MFLLVSFDLPTSTPEERKTAAKFRNYLLTQGFSRVQRSVYARQKSSPETAATLSRWVERAVPALGLVTIQKMTDEQYESIQKFENGRVVESEKDRDLVIF
jgi:CRISPR-associated protein Cas2